MSVVYSRSDPFIKFQSATEHPTGIIDETFLSSYKSSSSISSSASQGLKQGENLNKNQISEIFSDVSFSSRNNIEDKSMAPKGGNSYNSSLSTTPSSSSSSSSFSLSTFDNFQEKVSHIKMLITPMYSKFSISKKVRNFSLKITDLCF